MLHRFIFRGVLRKGYLSTFRASCLNNQSYILASSRQNSNPMHRKSRNRETQNPIRSCPPGPRIGRVGIEKQTSNFLREAQAPGHYGTDQRWPGFQQWGNGPDFKCPTFVKPAVVREAQPMGRPKVKNPGAPLPPPVVLSAVLSVVLTSSLCFPYGLSTSLPICHRLRASWQG